MGRVRVRRRAADALLGFVGFLTVPGVVALAALVPLASVSVLTSEGHAHAAAPPLETVELEADADDDDADGHEDGASPDVRGLARKDVVPLPARLRGRRVELTGAVAGARVLLAGKPLVLPATLPAGAELQGVRPTDDDAAIVVDDGKLRVALVVRAHGFEDVRAAPIAQASAYLSFSRALPEASPEGDPDGFRLTVRGKPSGPVDVVSLDPRGNVVGRLTNVAIDAPCAVSGPRCRRSRPLRLVVDSVDGNHPSSIGRSLVAEVGGLVVLARDGKKITSIRVGGPRGVVPEPYSVKIRATLFRADKSGKPSLFTNEVEAIAEVRKDLADARALWGQCGIAIDARGSDVRVASPPLPSLVAFGNDVGAPSSGGTVRVLVEGKKLAVDIPRGRSPLEAAQLFARAIEGAGFVAEVSRNARILPGAIGSADVRIARRGAPGVAVKVEADATLSNDPTLAVAIGVVDLSDGLTHFGDMDSPAGTLEERALVKSLDDLGKGDLDGRVVSVVYVPYFAGGGRIGESFIHGDGSSVRNVILIDRSGVRSRASSHAIAHELGHVLLDVPGHPDDFGKDTPHLLMDSDASDASAYGPRRLTNDECLRVIRESGPRAKAPLLEPLRRAPVPLPERL